MTSEHFNRLFAGFSKIKIGVIGDIMLDTYWWGNVERISPEAPVPVVAVSKREQRIGGAGNVALNIAALAVAVDVISVRGNDDEGRMLSGMLSENSIGTKYIVESNERITTNKIRIISRNQHMMRLDAEVVTMLSADEEQRLLASFEKYVQSEKPNLVILEDYNKGVLTETAIEKIISVCRANNIITAVDPKRKNFFRYRHVDIFKPNLKEAKEALNILGDEVSVEVLTDIDAELRKQLEHNVSFITLSEKGIFYADRDRHQIIPTHIRSIADVSGAGDTVIAVASVVYAVSKDINLMAEIANIAGGLVCEEVGTVAIQRDRLLHECIHLLSADNKS